MQTSSDQERAAEWSAHNQSSASTPRVCGGTTAQGAPLSLQEVERRHIAAMLQRTNWHQGRAASLLGISAKTLYRKIREFGFARPARGSRESARAWGRMLKNVENDARVSQSFA